MIFFAGPHLWIPPLFTNKNTFVSAKATQLQHIRGLVWSSAYRILRNINSMASDLMVLPRCYTTLMVTCSARNGGWTGHGFWSEPWTHCTQQLQHWMACKDETIWRETTTVQDLWWMAVIFCFITSFIKAFHLSPVFFYFPRYRQRLHRWLSWIFRTWCGYWQPYLSHVGQRSYPLSGSFGAFWCHFACDEQGMVPLGMGDVDETKTASCLVQKMALRVTGL